MSTREQIHHGILYHPVCRRSSVDFARTYRKVFTVLLSAVTIGFIFAMFTMLVAASDRVVMTDILMWGMAHARSSQYTDSQVIITVGTALVLYVCLERIYSDPVFILVGSFYLTMVGVVGAAAVASGLPDPFMHSSFWTASLYMAIALVAFWVLKVAFRYFMVFLDDPELR